MTPEPRNPQKLYPIRMPLPSAHVGTLLFQTLPDEQTEPNVDVL